MPSQSSAVNPVCCITLALALAGAASGCSKNAIVHGAHGAAIEGPIIGSDARSVTVELDGAPHVIPREGIRDIDHPGNVWLTVGAIGTAIGLASGVGGAAVAYDATHDPSRDGWQRLGAGLAGAITAAFGLAELLIFVPVAIWGGVVWSDSRERAEANAPRRPRRPRYTSPRAASWCVSEKKSPT